MQGGLHLKQDLSLECLAVGDGTRNRKVTTSTPIGRTRVVP